MYKELETRYHVARKEHTCIATEWLKDSFENLPLTKSEKLIVEMAIKAKGVIRKGTKYIRQTIFTDQFNDQGEPEVYVYKARLDLHELCQKYGVFDAK